MFAKVKRFLLQCKSRQIGLKPAEDILMVHYHFKGSHTKEVLELVYMNTQALIFFINILRICIFLSQFPALHQPLSYLLLHVGLWESVNKRALISSKEAKIWLLNIFPGQLVSPLEKVMNKWKRQASHYHITVCSDHMPDAH